ncbi:MAG: putative Ig domain-containing protein, partial [Solirubrobacteraceae bacterium]
NGVISGTPTAPAAATVTVSAADQFTNSGSAQFTWTVVAPGPPTVSGAALSGVKTRKAKLKFTISAGSNAPAVSSVTVSLPGGLSFARLKQKTLAKSIKLTGASFKARFAGGRLTITFKRATGRATVTISATLLKVSGALAGKVSRHKVKRVTIDFRVLDATGRPTSVAVRLKV